MFHCSTCSTDFLTEKAYDAHQHCVNCLHYVEAPEYELKGKKTILGSAVCNDCARLEEIRCGRCGEESDIIPARPEVKELAAIAKQALMCY